MSNRLLEGIKDGEQLKIAAAGAWIAENARNLETLIDGETLREGVITRVDIDMGRVERLDTFWSTRSAASNQRQRQRPVAMP